MNTLFKTKCLLLFKVNAPVKEEQLSETGWSIDADPPESVNNEPINDPLGLDDTNSLIQINQNTATTTPSSNYTTQPTNRLSNIARSQNPPNSFLPNNNNVNSNSNHTANVNVNSKSGIISSNSSTNTNKTSLTSNRESNSDLINLNSDQVCLFNKLLINNNKNKSLQYKHFYFCSTL